MSFLNKLLFIFFLSGLGGNGLKATYLEQNIQKNSLFIEYNLLDIDTDINPILMRSSIFNHKRLLLVDKKYFEGEVKSPIIGLYYFHNQTNNVKPD
tara:strand:+ start:217 stop:504 length:288 start_codon:yes stop_codon:yes gene_type:complete